MECCCSCNQLRNAWKRLTKQRDAIPLRGSEDMFEDAQSCITGQSMFSVFEEDRYDDAMVPNVIGMEEDSAGYYHMALQMTLNSKADWDSCLDSEKIQARARYLYTPGDSYTWISLTFTLNAHIAEVIAATHEADLWPKWHPIVYSNEILESTTPWRLKCHWKKSLAMGMLKGDVVPDIHRYVNEDKCFFLEHVRPLEATDSSYVPPQRGLQRELLQSAALIIPIGTEQTLVLTTLRIDLGITPPARMVRSMLPTIASQSAMTYHKTMKTIQNAKKGAAWQKRMEMDEDGVYAILKRMAAKSVSIPKRLDLTYASPNECFSTFLE